MFTSKLNLIILLSLGILMNVACNRNSINQYRFQNQQLQSFTEFYRFSTHQFNLKGNIKSIELIDQHNDHNKHKYTYNRKKEITSSTSVFNQIPGYSTSIFEQNLGTLEYVDFKNEKTVFINDLESNDKQNDTIKYINQHIVFKYLKDNLQEITDSKGQPIVIVKYYQDSIVKQHFGKFRQKFIYDNKRRLIYQETKSSKYSQQKLRVKYDQQDIVNIISDFYSISKNKRTLKGHQKLRLDRKSETHISGEFKFIDYSISGKSFETSIDIYIEFNSNGDVKEQKLPEPKKNDLWGIKHYKFDDYKYDAEMNWIERSVIEITDPSTNPSSPIKQKRIIEYL